MAGAALGGPERVLADCHGGPVRHEVREYLWPFTAPVSFVREAYTITLAQRAGLVYLIRRGPGSRSPSLTWHRSIADALALPGDGMVLVADGADNPGGGGLEDSVALLGALIDAGIDRVAFGMICDPATLQACIAAGPGATLAVQLGGHSGGAFLGPLALRVQVVSVQPGQFTFTGPMSRGITLDIGPTAVVRVGGIDIVVAGTRHQVLDPGFFTHAGLDPAHYDLVVVKSSQHFRAAFGPMARTILVIDSGDGLTSFDLAAFGHSRVRRPVHPLDELPD